MLPRCRSNFKTIQTFKHPISCLWDFAKSHDKMSYRILKQGAELYLIYPAYFLPWPLMSPVTSAAVHGIDQLIWKYSSFSNRRLELPFIMSGSKHITYSRLWIDSIATVSSRLLVDISAVELGSTLCEFKGPNKFWRYSPQRISLQIFQIGGPGIGPLRFSGP